MEIRQETSSAEVAQEVVETKKELTQEEQLVQMRSMANMKHKMLSQLVGVHIDGFSAIMLNGNGVSYAKKLEAAKALKEAFQFALDFGLNVSKAKIRQSGSALAKETNNLAGVLVQALDNRMLILADNMAKQEKEQNSATESTVVEETKTGETNNV